MNIIFVEDLDKFKKRMLSTRDKFLHLQLDDNHYHKNIHYIQMNIMFLSVVFLDQPSTIYIIGFNHTDLTKTFNIKELYKDVNISKLLSGYVFEKRFFNTLFKEDNYKLDITCLTDTIDVGILNYYYHHTNILDILHSKQHPLYKYEHLLNKLLNYNDKGIKKNKYKFIPIYHLINYTCSVFDYCITNNLFLITLRTDELQNYDLMYINLYNTERFGINIEDKIEYTNYNIYSSTSRPSNSFKINYNSISKTSGYRDNIKSKYKNGKLVEFDIKYSHLQLLEDLIDIKLPNQDVYDYFNDLLNLNQTREELKSTIFTILYNDEVRRQYLHIDLVKKIDNYINSIISNSYIRSKIYNKYLYKEGDFSKGKYLNYIIQLHETERNLSIYKELYDYLKENNLQDKINMILYIYDSFVFDVDEQYLHLINTNSQIYKIITRNNTIKIHYNIGNTFGELTK